MRTGWPRALAFCRHHQLRLAYTRDRRAAAMVRDVPRSGPTEASDGCGWVCWTLPASDAFSLVGK